MRFWFGFALYCTVLTVIFVSTLVIVLTPNTYPVKPEVTDVGKLSGMQPYPPGDPEPWNGPDLAPEDRLGPYVVIMDWGDSFREDWWDLALEESLK